MNNIRRDIIEAKVVGGGHDFTTLTGALNRMINQKELDMELVKVKNNNMFYPYSYRLFNSIKSYLKK